MKRVVAAMLMGGAITSGCAGPMTYGENPWVPVDLAEDRVEFKRYGVAPARWTDDLGREYEQMLRKEAKAHCAVHGRRAGEPLGGSRSECAASNAYGCLSWIQTRVYPV